MRITNKKLYVFYSCINKSKTAFNSYANLLTINV